MGNRIRLNARIIGRRVSEVSSFARESLNLALAFQDWRQAYRNRGNRNAIFMWIPKTAGYSLFNVLGRHGAQKLPDESQIERYFENRGIVTFGHISVRHLLEAGQINEEFWQSAWKFAFVRNPYARAVSLLKYLRRIKVFPPSTTFRIFCSYLAERAYEPIGLQNQSGLSMMNPQVAWLVDENGRLLPDYISKVKDAERGYATIVQELQLKDAPARLPQENRSADLSVARHYDNETRAIVAEAYREDFERFGFDPSILPD